MLTWNGTPIDQIPQDDIATWAAIDAALPEFMRRRYGPQETALRLGLSPSYLKRLVGAGRLKADLYYGERRTPMFFLSTLFGLRDAPERLAAAYHLVSEETDLDDGDYLFYIGDRVAHKKTGQKGVIAGRHVAPTQTADVIWDGQDRAESCKPEWLVLLGNDDAVIISFDKHKQARRKRRLEDDNP